MLIRCSKESQHPAEWALGLRLSSPRERERHNVTVITVGSKYYSLCSVSSSLSQENPTQPFRTLAIKWEVYILLKKASCVVYYCVCYQCVGMYPAYICVFLHEDMNSLSSHWDQCSLASSNYIVIYEALCFDIAQGRMNGAPNETRTHSCRFASQAC